MQVYFWLTYRSNSRAMSFSKKTFDSHLQPYLDRATQVVDQMTDGCNWWAYKVLIPVESRADAIEVRKGVEAALQKVNSKLKPNAFRFFDKDVTLDQINVVGDPLTSDR